MTGVADRPFTTGLFLLRCLQVGLSMADLDYLDVGMIMDIFTENANDAEEYEIIATQSDFDRF